MKELKDFKVVNTVVSSSKSMLTVTGVAGKGLQKLCISISSNRSTAISAANCKSVRQTLKLRNSFNNVTQIGLSFFNVQNPRIVSITTRNNTSHYLSRSLRFTQKQQVKQANLASQRANIRSLSLLHSCVKLF